MRGSGTVTESARELPVLGEYDLVVCGGGFAGFGAACAAARQGADVLLVERSEQLGGLGSLAGVGGFSYGAPWEGVSHGREFDGVVAALRDAGALGEENGWPLRGQAPFFNMLFDHQMLPFVMLRLAEEAGVHLLFATDIVGALRDGPNATHALIHNRSLTAAVAADSFIDATGDGVFARHAGASALPHEASGEEPELIKPSYMVYLARARREALPPGFPAYDATISRDPSYSVWPEPDRVGLKLKMYDRSWDTGDGEGYSECAIAFRKEVSRAVRHFAARSGRPAETEGPLGLAFAPPALGLREGRRIEGDYVLTGEDLRAGRHFDDAVAWATSCLDYHDSHITVPPYQIPYRCLLAKGLDNVLVAGRCFSGDRLALSSARVMPTCCLMGSAAGHAAAVSLSEGQLLRELDAAAVCRALEDGAGNPAYVRKMLSTPGEATKEQGKTGEGA